MNKKLEKKWDEKDNCNLLSTLELETKKESLRILI